MLDLVFVVIGVREKGNAVEKIEDCCAAIFIVIVIVLIQRSAYSVHNAHIRVYMPTATTIFASPMSCDPQHHLAIQRIVRSACSASIGERVRARLLGREKERHE